MANEDRPSAILSEYRPIGSSAANLTLQPARDEMTVALAGELDLTAEDDVVATLLRAADTPNLVALRVDLTRVSFIDASGLRALLTGLQAAVGRGIAFALGGVTPEGRVAKLLAITELDQHFEVDASG